MPPKDILPNWNLCRLSAPPPPPAHSTVLRLSETTPSAATGMAQLRWWCCGGGGGASVQGMLVLLSLNQAREAQWYEARVLTLTRALTHVKECYVAFDVTP